MEELDPPKPHILKNETCIYCGSILSQSNISREHVIGRRFLPKGKLENCWNLIANACNSCNNDKSILENDISAITMQPTLSGQYAVDDEVLIKESKRKANNCKSHLSGKLVKDSHESLSIKANPYKGLLMEFNLTSAPQIETERLYTLAMFHIKAFYYLLTYNDNINKGQRCVGSFMPLIEGLKSDWGNVLFKDFMSETFKWSPRLVTITADGFFKASIREYHSSETWSWALEWNHKYRLVGFFGSPDPVKKICKNFRKLNKNIFKDQKGNLTSIRTEKNLDPNQDLLFSWSN